MTFLEEFRCTLPEGELDGVRIERFTVTEEELSEEPGAVYLRLQGREIPAGTWTRLVVDDKVWMSDTPPEARDHALFYFRCERSGARRILVNGLGLGCIVRALYRLPSVVSVDVVERDERVLQLVGAPLLKEVEGLPHNVALWLWHGDAFARADAFSHSNIYRWDAAWHDIWPGLDVSDLAEMDRLEACYAGRVGFQESWGRRLLEQDRGGVVAELRRSLGLES